VAVYTHIPLTPASQTASLVSGRATIRYTETTTFYQNDLAIRGNADVTVGKPNAVRLQSISGMSAANPLVNFHDIHGRKGHHTGQTNKKMCAQS
jgi:hypothetical protein